ncbi:MAG TPA: hypothetical protein PLZ36_16525, partial [Armatimonadota bacterium]|nr:hypothetical protein [Armatimonadota bacterium]
MRYLVLLLACLSLAAHAAMTFTIKDYLQKTWTNELVTYTVKLPASQAKRVTLIGPDGKAVPVQVTPKGTGTAQVAFIVEELPADGEVKYTLKAGKPVGGSLWDMQCDPPQLTSGVLRLLPSVGTGTLTYTPPVPLSSFPAPIMEVGSPAGLYGHGKLIGDLPVTRITSTVLADGPVYVEQQREYLFQGGGYYRLTFRVVKGQNAVLVREEFDTPKTAAGKALMTFSLSTNFHPDRVSAAIRTWRQRTDPKTNALGDDYKLDFDEARKEMSILGYVNWWPETARRATFYNSTHPNGDTISILPANIGWWRNPMGMYVMTEPGGKVRLDLPLYIDQDWVRDGVEWGNPYYTGKVEAGWPRTAGRRAWVLHVDARANVFPTAGRSSVLEAVRKYCDLPLDKVKDWVLDWPADPKVTYPRCSSTMTAAVMN